MNLYLKLAIFYLIIVCVFLLLAYEKHQSDKVLDAFYDGFRGILHDAESSGKEVEEKRD